MSAESPYMQRKACAACPFRTDRPFYLDPSRAREFARMIELGTFDCHKTIEFGDEGEQVKQPNTQACAGGRYMLAPGKSRLEWLAERMGALIHDVHPNQPVFDTIEDWLDAVDNMHSPRSPIARAARRIQRDGEEITREQVDAIAHRFRTEIGGVYDLIAARIEHDHREKAS